MQEIDFDDETYEFEDDVSDDEIMEFLQPTPEPEKEKLEPGVYQDDNNELFRVTDSGEIHAITEGEA